MAWSIAHGAECMAHRAECIEHRTDDGRLRSEGRKQTTDYRRQEISEFGPPGLRLADPAPRRVRRNWVKLLSYKTTQTF